jgi:hypothetical protein
MRIKAFVLTLCVVLTLAGSGAAFARAPEDGFVSARKMESRYFTIQLSPGVDEFPLIQNLGVGPEHKILAGQAIGGAQFSSNSLSDILDAFFLWSCSVLDMQLYSYRGNVKVVPDESSLADIYRRLYGMERKGEKAFYVYEVNTVYVAAQNFTKEIVGHEVAHAIISNFFVVQPPEKVQEVLAGYIEYQLRKNPVLPVPDATPPPIKF